MIVVVLTGCDKYIDIKEKGKVIPTTINDFDKLLSTQNDLMFNGTNMFRASDEIRIYEDEAAGIFFGAEAFTNGYLWKDYALVNNADPDPDWEEPYEQIYICNVVLDKIDAAVGSDEALRNKTRGEALAHRAYCYFMLTNEYGKHYNPATYATDLAVPLYLKADINAALPRATVKEAYELIEKDLITALELLPPITTYNYRPTKAGVHGLLSKVYLYQAKYELARTHANAALQINNFLHDFKAYDYVPGAPMFVGLLGFLKSPYENKEIVWHKEGNNKFIYSKAVYMSDEHKALYAPGDRRLYFMVIDFPPFGPNAHGGGIWTKEGFMKTGVTTPELYLIRAECNARLGQPGTAIDDLNTLRIKRFKAADYVPLDRNQTDLDALKLVLKERRLELFSEGWRWFDLKRLNLDDRFKRNITRVWNGQTITLTPNSNNYLFPIPKKVMMLNKLLEQNPRDNRQ